LTSGNAFYGVGVGHGPEPYMSAGIGIEYRVAGLVLAGPFEKLDYQGENGLFLDLEGGAGDKEVGVGLVFPGYLTAHPHATEQGLS